jgi:epimerase EvaD
MPDLRVRELAVEGAYEFTPPVFPDERGLFVSPFQSEGFAAALGRKHFPVAQTNHSRSRRGAVRGVHYTATPPGCAKYVYCARGSALDIMVDTRVGSPTYGKWDAVLLDTVDFRTMYFPVGVGHAFVALEDDTVMSYMLTGSYVVQDERALQATDPALGLPIPTDVPILMSERDSVAPRMADVAERGELPDYRTCREIEEALWH